MTVNAEILLDGTYLYYQGQSNYCQENFKLVHLKELQQFHVYAEVLSRMENGEFLKILVRYETNHVHQPLFARIEKSIGNRSAQETFRFDGSSNDLKYEFQSSQINQEYRKVLSARHYITTPAFSTSAIFTLTKKFDTTGRTPVTFIGSNNEWTYEGPPEEKIVFTEFKVSEGSEFHIGGNQLPATQLLLYQFDSSNSQTELPVEVLVSKHHGIPYQLQHGDQRIVIKSLKRSSRD